MSLPGKAEFGVELPAWNASEPATGVPIKKRRFLRIQSLSPPPSHSAPAGADNCDTQMKEVMVPAVESSISGVSPQMPNTGCADIRELSLEFRTEDVSGREVNLALNCGTFPSFSEGLFTLSATAATELGNEGKIISENRPTVRSILGTDLETTELRSTLGDGSIGNKFISSDKSAFQRVSTNTGRSEPSLGKTALVGSGREGQPSSCNLELTLSESQYCSPSKQIVGLGSSHDNQHSSRSHWDLNTTMDTWERSIVETTLNHGEGGDNEVDLGYMHGKRPEMELIDKSAQESTGIQAMSGKCELSQNTCNLKLPNTLKLACENSGINTDLNLQLNTEFGSTAFSKLCAPFAPPTPSLHKVFDSSLSVKQMALTQSLKLTACDVVKTEPVEDGRSGKNTGVSNFKSANQGIIKSEALDIAEQGVKTMCQNGVRTACGGAVKLEQLEVPCLEGPRKTEGKAHNYECSSDAQELVKTGEIHHGKEGSAAWSLSVTQGIVGFSKMHDTLRKPNADVSLVMEESLSKVTSLVLNDTKLDLSQDMPCNAGQPHAACHTIDSSVSHESVISDINDSHNAPLMPAHVVPQDAEENIPKASELSFETTAMVCNEPSQAKGARAMVDDASNVLLDSESKEQKDLNSIQGITEPISYTDIGTQPAVVSMDVHTGHTSTDNKVNQTAVVGGEIKKPVLCKIENEPCSSHEAAGVKERVPKQHNDDDDYEDGEFRESLLRDVMKGNAKEKKNVIVEEDVKSNSPPRIRSPMPENDGKLKSMDESKDVHCTVESEVSLFTKKADTGLNMTEDLKDSSAIQKPITIKKKALKITRKMPQELGKEDLKSKSTHQNNLSSSHARSPDSTGADLGSLQPKASGDQSSPSKAGALRTYDATKCVKGRSDRNHITRLSSPSNASSGRIKSSYSRSLSRSEREMIMDKSVGREKVHMKSSRDETHIRRMRKSEKERDLDQALRNAGPDRVHMRGKIVQQFNSLRGDWDPEHGAGRTGKKHVDDELCSSPTRRPSPGGSGPLPVGVQMLRRTMRDISPDDMVNSSLLVRTRPNYEPGRNCLIRRERSLSPFQRRAAAHTSNISFPSSTRRRARSPHMWSPSRRPADVYDGLPDLIRCRSPDLRVERVRSPGERACFQENMLGRRHISPHMAQLHGEMPDVNLMRAHDLPKAGRHPQGNLRRFDLIDHCVNPDNFGHLQPGQFHGLEGGDMYDEERRNSDEGHGLARPFRQQHYIVGDDVGNDGGFHHHVEDIPQRPIRLCQDADEEFPGRGISRVGSIRNRLGNVHNNRRLRVMDEQEDNYRHHNGQGWHGAGFKDVRMKRRRF